jgi:hypothetical protein
MVMSVDQESVTLDPHQWNVIMDVLRLDSSSEDAANRLGDVASQVRDILADLQRQLKRDGIERH